MLIFTGLDQEPLIVVITLQCVLQWLNEEKIIQRLVEIVHPSQEEDVSICVTITLIFLMQESC